MKFTPKISPSEFAFLVLGYDLYPWQIEALEAMATGKKVALVAANGSGKTARVIAVSVLWFLYCFPTGRVVAVSGDWNQVKTQLYNEVLSHRDNPLIKSLGWTFLKVPEIETPQGGYFRGRSTNDELKLEGYHEKPDSPFFYIVDEAKSISIEKFSGIDRTTRTFSLTTSSPGQPYGHFYDMFHANRSLFYCVKVTAYDCPHIRPEDIEYKKRLWGEASPLFRSSILAEFTLADENTIISEEELSLAVEYSEANYSPWDADNLKGAFDFACGRDKNTLSACDGDRAEVIDSFADRDTTQGYRRLRRSAEGAGILPYNIIGDADGAGYPMIISLREEGYRIKEFRGGEKARDDKHYTNLISEVWFTGCRAIANQEIKITGMTPDLFKQLTTRRAEIDSKGRLRAEPKDSMRERGLHSPDDADSLLMAIYLSTHNHGAWRDLGTPKHSLEDMGLHDFSKSGF